MSRVPCPRLRGHATRSRFAGWNAHACVGMAPALRSAHPTSCRRGADLPGPTRETLPCAVSMPVPELLDLVGLAGREVVRFAAVGGQVVELPRQPCGGDQLPFAHADRPIALVIPPEIIVRHGAVLGQGRHQALAGRRRHGLAAKSLRPAAAGQLEDRRRQVDEVARIVAQFAAGGDAARPVDDQRRGDAPFVDPDLCRRKGVFAALDQAGPMQRNVLAEPGGAVRSCPSPRIICSALAPLSERKKITVFSRRPSPGADRARGRSRRPCGGSSPRGSPS